MGLYYKAIIGDEIGKKRTVYNPSVLLPNGEEKFMGYKMEEHMAINNPFMDSFAPLLDNSRKRVIWVVDADFILGAPDEETHLHPLVGKRVFKRTPISIPTYEEAWGEDGDKTESKAIPLCLFNFDYDGVYLVNWEKKLYLDMQKYINKHTRVFDRGGYEETYCPSPVPLLTDMDKPSNYKELANGKVLYRGAWAWDLISFSHEIPQGFTEVEW